MKIFLLSSLFRPFRPIFIFHRSCPKPNWCRVTSTHGIIYNRKGSSRKPSQIYVFTGFRNEAERLLAVETFGVYVCPPTGYVATYNKVYVVRSTTIPLHMYKRRRALIPPRGKSLLRNLWKFFIPNQKSLRKMINLVR